MKTPCVRMPAALVREVFDKLPQRVVVVSEAGKIVAFNDAWVRFAHENGNPDLIGAGIGDDYLETHRAPTESFVRFADLIRTGIWGVLRGSHDYFKIDYPQHSSNTEHWVRLQALPLVYSPGCALLIHSPIERQENAQRSMYDGVLGATVDGQRNVEHRGLNLAPRQSEVLQLLVEGRSYREIATTMGITEKTVDYHIAALKKKLGCNRSSDLIRVAIHENLASEALARGGRA